MDENREKNINTHKIQKFSAFNKFKNKDSPND